jgi:hypothetical protein
MTADGGISATRYNAPTIFLLQRLDRLHVEYTGETVVVLADKRWLGETA